MSGKPFDEKAKARLANHILSGGKHSADEPEKKDNPVEEKLEKKVEPTTGAPTPFKSSFSGSMRKRFGK